MVPQTPMGIQRRTNSAAHMHVAPHDKNPDMSLSQIRVPPRDVWLSPPPENDPGRMPNTSDELPSRRPTQSDVVSVQDYLHNSGVHSLLGKLMEAVIMSRPAEPVFFIAELMDRWRHDLESAPQDWPTSKKRGALERALSASAHGLAESEQVGV